MICGYDSRPTFFLLPDLASWRSVLILFLCRPLTAPRSVILLTVVLRFIVFDSPQLPEAWRMARKSLDDLGVLQKAVMETVWELGEATVQQVLDRLGRDRDKSPAYTTILTVLQKLEKGGWVTHRAEGRSYV